MADPDTKAVREALVVIFGIPAILVGAMLVTSLFTDQLVVTAWSLAGAAVLWIAGTWCLVNITIELSGYRRVLGIHPVVWFMFALIDFLAGCAVVASPGF